MRSASIIGFLLLLSLSALAQSEEQATIDSLEQLLTKPHPDSTRLRIINRLVYHYTDVNTARFIELSEESLRLIGSASTKSDEGSVYMNMGLATEAKGDYTASLSYNAKALQIFQSLQDSIGISSILNNIGIAYNQMGDYSMAVYYLLKAAEVDELSNNEYSSSIDFINLSESYYNAKSYDISIEWSRKAFQILKAPEDESSKGYASEMLAMAYIEKEMYDSALFYIKLAQAISKKFNNEYLNNRATRHLGRMYLKMGQYDSAQYYLEQTIKNSKDKHLADVLLPTQLLYAQYLVTQKKYDLALQQALDAYNKSLEIKNRVISMESCELAASIYEKAGDKDKTIQYQKLANELRQKIMEQSVQGSIQAKAFDIVLEKEKKEKQAAVSSLEQSGKVLVRQRLLLFVGAIAVLILASLLYLLRKINVDRKQANEQLTQNNFQLNKLNQEINGLIHTIVHDLKSPLNSLQGILFLIEPELKSPASIEMLQHGHKALKSGHEIIKELLELRELEEKPLSLQLEQVSLKLMIEEIIAEHMPYADQKEITLMASAPDISVALDKQIMKRLITNLVSNAIKFSSKGKPVSIQAQATDKSIIFEVKDEGPGFKPSDLEKMYSKFQRLSARPTGGESSHGLGLAIVDLLVKRLDGTIDLQTEYGKGSAFTITVPVSN